MGEAADFFELPAAPPAQAKPRSPQPWEPPHNVVGVEVPFELIIARSPKVVAVLGHITAFPNGFSFNLSMRSKPGHQMAANGFHGWRTRRRRWRARLPADIFRFGIGFADGSGATNLQIMGFGAPEPPKPPILLGGGGGGSESRYELSYWVWPLPPPGPLTLFMEWPAEGLSQTTFELDSELIRTAGISAEIIGAL